MNCLEYRRLATEAGGHEDAAMRAHREGCESCQVLARSLRELEEQIEQTLRVPAPESMAARIVFRQRLSAARDAEFDAVLERAVRVDVPDGLAERIVARSAQARGRSGGGGEPALVPARPLARFAMAASIALAVALGSLFMLRPVDTTVLDRAIAHVAAEPWLLEGEATISHAQLAPVLRMVGLDMSEMPGEVTRAIPCPASKKLSLHMVLRGEHGKVTVIVTPGERVAQRLAGRQSGLAGLVVPVRHGALKVIGDPAEDLQAYAERTRKVLRWRM